MVARKNQGRRGVNNSIKILTTADWQAEWPDTHEMIIYGGYRYAIMAQPGRSQRGSPALLVAFAMLLALVPGAVAYVKQVRC